MTQQPRISHRFEQRLPRWHARSIYAGFAFLLASGLGWLWLHNFVSVAGPFGPTPHPAEPLTVKLHGIIAYAFLLLLGALIPVHLRLGWAGKRSLATGLLTAGAMVLLVLTGLGLYYAGGEELRALASLSHWLIGLAAALALVSHAIRGRQRHARGLPRPTAPVRRAPRRIDPV
jgi:hypothetical protein